MAAAPAAGPPLRGAAAAVSPGPGPGPCRAGTPSGAGAGPEPEPDAEPEAAGAQQRAPPRPAPRRHGEAPPGPAGGCVTGPGTGTGPPGRALRRGGAGPAEAGSRRPPGDVREPTALLRPRLSQREVAGAEEELPRPGGSRGNVEQQGRAALCPPLPGLWGDCSEATAAQQPCSIGKLRGKRNERKKKKISVVNTSP